MKWNDEVGYIEYKTSISNLKSLLGISDINFTKRCELAPYITYIVKYLNTRLISLDTDDIKVFIQEIFDIQDFGADKIIDGKIKDLLLVLGISDDDIYIEGEEIPYNQDRFVFSWADFLSSLVTRLKLQYSGLLNKQSTECPCEYPPGQDTKDYESWTSGIYPEDENNSYFDFESSNVGWRVGNDKPVCNKCERRGHE